MKLEINERSNAAVYTQIVNQVRFAIASGTLNAADQLPSVRELSETLNVNPNTVAKSYRDLEVMGYVYSRRGMGVFIQKGIEKQCGEKCREDIIRSLYQLCSEAKAAGVSAADFKSLTKSCWDSDGFIYADTPAAILKLAKGKSS